MKIISLKNLLLTLISDNMNITDIFGNTIEVPDLKKAIEQTTSLVVFSKADPILFQEYLFRNDVDDNNKPLRLKYCPENAKTVTSFEFYTHQLEQLKKLENEYRKKYTNSRIHGGFPY